ncbi:MobA/MobL family protein [Psychrobacter sp. GP33]|uniref:MobA/MobL family protein n=1 Tax=Psychrobacter sp. GP33 TaxID=2758709 RepID=UPI0015FCB777|nr:MobA/MobL family protein [Psychrobacter sp. GP33]
MALFRAEVKPISRGKGHNAVAAAAYRAGEKLTDTNPYNPNRTEHDFSKKSDVLHKAIVLPTALAQTDFSISRQDLWSQVEAHEVTQRGQKMKSNARVAREWLLALPHELRNAENIELAEEFALRIANDLGVIADCCIHDPSLKSRAPAPKPSAKTADKESEREDERNIHAHIMFTTRKATLNAQNELLFTDKADCELDGTARKNKGLVKEADYLKEIRALWAEMLNERLVAHGIAPVTAVSYQDRNLDILPNVHTGRNPLTNDKKRYNDVINDRNQRVLLSRVDTLKGLANQANEIVGITNSVTTRRKQAAAELVEQTRRFDQASKRENGGAHYRDRDVEDAYQRVELNKKRLASLFVTRHREDKRLRVGWNEDPNDYPEKFDYRQSALLDQFSQNFNMGQQENEDTPEYHQRITQLMTVDFRSANEDMVNLLRNPKAERAQYNAIKQDFDDFIHDLDKQREDHKDQIRLPIERLNTTTDMVKVVATAVNYLQKLDDYVKNETTAETNKALAREHCGKTIDRTVEAYRIACFGIPNFQNPDIHRTHSETLQVALNDFTKGYGNELSKEQQGTLNRSFDDMNKRQPQYTYKPRR